MEAEDSRNSEDLEAELLADSRVQVGCAVCEWLAGRDDAVDWDKAFKNDRITSAAILRGMRQPERGFQHKDKPVQTHRREKHRAG